MLPDDIIIGATPYGYTSLNDSESGRIFQVDFIVFSLSTGDLTVLLWVTNQAAVPGWWFQEHVWEDLSFS